MPQLKLIIDLADQVDEDMVIDYINCVALCKLEEDMKEVTHWEWIRHDQLAAGGMK